MAQEQHNDGNMGPEGEVEEAQQNNQPPPRPENNPNILIHTFGNIRSNIAGPQLFEEYGLHRAFFLVGLFEESLGFHNGVPYPILLKYSLYGANNGGRPTPQESQLWEEQLTEYLDKKSDPTQNDNPYYYFDGKTVKLTDHGLNRFRNKKDIVRKFFNSWCELLPKVVKNINRCIEDVASVYTQNVKELNVIPANNQERANKLCLYFASSGRVQFIFQYLFNQPGWKAKDEITKGEGYNTVHAKKIFSDLNPATITNLLFVQCSPVVENVFVKGTDYFRIREGFWVDLPDNFNIPPGQNQNQNVQLLPSDLSSDNMDNTSDEPDSSEDESDGSDGNTSDEPDSSDESDGSDESQWGWSTNLNCTL